MEIYNANENVKELTDAMLSTLNESDVLPSGMKTSKRFILADDRCTNKKVIAYLLESRNGDSVEYTLEVIDEINQEMHTYHSENNETAYDIVSKAAGLLAENNRIVIMENDYVLITTPGKYSFIAVIQNKTDSDVFFAFEKGMDELDFVVPANSWYGIPHNEYGELTYDEIRNGKCTISN